MFLFSSCSCPWLYWTSTARQTCNTEDNFNSQKTPDMSHSIRIYPNGLNGIIHAMKGFWCVFKATKLLTGRDRIKISLLQINSCSLYIYISLSVALSIETARVRDRERQIDRTDKELLAWWRRQMWTFSALLALCAVNSHHKGQWRGAFVFSLIRAWTNDWVNNRDTGD